MQILVTGVAGFIGFSFAKKILDKNYEVLGIDNLDNYYSINLKKSRLKILKKYTNFKFLKKDISEKNFYKTKMSKKIKIIVHLAAQAGVRYSIVNPEKYLKSNITGFFNIIKLAKRNNIKKILYASSSSVYGDSKKFPLSEKDVINPKNFYAFSKSANENMADIFSKIYPMSFLGLRFFTAYGPWGRPDMMMMKYLIAAKKNKHFELYNYGNHYRDFTYIDDVTEILFKLLKKKINNNHIVLNICSSRSIKISKVIELLGNEYKKIKIKKVKFQLADVYKTFGNNKLVKSFFPKIKFTKYETGVKNTVSWFKKYSNLF